MTARRQVRWATLVVAIALLALGAVWIFQGVGAIKGSFMTGDRIWAWIGAACVVAGLAVGARGLRRAG